ncbi:MDR family NADPH-dependent oxidoreductase [Bradyrhizobium erythrophlei]|uniref:MDR family NADPH-dependent oxidoreductase n=1 Tax=Bradyrhizobium erythrophlei TaxID=1437360 RepID=UPI0035E65E87
MKQIEFAAAGKPEEVVVYADAEAPSGTGPDEVLVKVLAFPINPADLLTMQGIYPRLDTTTSAIGNEAVGEIAAVGANVGNLVPGDRVILLSLNNWREFRLLKASEVVKVSTHGDVVQQAGLKVNPATANLLLHQFVELKAGDWIIQNAANSAVGRAAIQLARILGIKTVNIVRRSDVLDELRALGADVVLLDGDDLPQRVGAATENATIPLGIDCVSGNATDRIASCLGPGATLAIYGAISGERANVAPGTIVFNDLRIRGLWLSKYLMDAPREAIEALYRRLDGVSISGQMTTKIDSIFRADDIKGAVRRASQTGIDGKVIVTFN